MKTIKEIAEELNVTAQTVRNEIERQNENKSKSKSGKGFVLEDDAAERIKSAIIERQQSQSKTKGKPKPKQNEDLVLFLRNEIEAKNRQIEAIQKQVSELQEQTKVLTAALENVTESLRASQALHAGTLQKQIEAAADLEQQPEETQQGQRNRKWWQFWK